MARKLFLFLATIMILSITAACGASKTALNVTMSDFKFSPDRFTVPAGAEVTLNLKNSSALEHDFVIMILDKNATLPFGEDDKSNIYWEGRLDPHQASTVTFTAPQEPGEYEVVCSAAGHLEQGMRATLTVAAP